MGKTHQAVKRQERVAIAQPQITALRLVLQGCTGSPICCPTHSAPAHLPASPAVLPSPQPIASCCLYCCCCHCWRGAGASTGRHGWPLSPAAAAAGQAPVGHNAEKTQCSSTAGHYLSSRASPLLSCCTAFTRPQGCCSSRAHSLDHQPKRSPSLSTGRATQTCLGLTQRAAPVCPLAPGPPPAAVPVAAAAAHPC